MVTRIPVPRNCVKQLTIMGWVFHGAGVLSMAIALATEHWLRRLSNGRHVGIFPCCPTFKCGTTTISDNGKTIGTFTDMIVVALMLVGLGLIFSLTHSCVTWRNDKRTLLGLSFVASGLVTIGGIILVAGAIQFVTSFPGNMQDILREQCQTPDDVVQTGFSFGLFVAGAVAFILAGIMLFLSSCKLSYPHLLTRQTIARNASTMPLETVSAYLESHEQMPSVTDRFSEGFNNSVYSSDVEEHRSSSRRHRISISTPVYQRDRLSPDDCLRHQHGRLSPHASPRFRRDSLSPHTCSHHRRDRLSPHASPRYRRDSLSPHTSSHHRRDRRSPHASPHQRDRLSLHASPHQRDTLSPRHQRRVSSHTEEHGGITSLCDPPSYESLQEFFSQNDSEYSTRDTTEHHFTLEATEQQSTLDITEQDSTPYTREQHSTLDTTEHLQSNSVDSAAQPPTYDDYLIICPPTCKD